MNKPVIAVPMGDPSGIGPEIALKALLNPSVSENCLPIIIGNLSVLKRIRDICGLAADINLLSEDLRGSFRRGAANLIQVEDPSAETIEYGKVMAESGRLAYSCIVKSVELALKGKADALATTPINKESFKAAGISSIGHTELLAELTQSHDPLTLFQVRNLRVFFLTRHVSLRKACELVTKQRIIDYTQRCVRELVNLGIENPRFAVAGLNPHSSDNGLFGTEELAEIKPAVEALKAMGYEVFGPVPADSVFYQALNGRYDAVLSLYHDQGHIATKMVDFERTISLTLGLPFLRTSVDHGTAFDIAGMNLASPVSMEEAIRLAADYCKHKPSSI